MSTYVVMIFEQAEDGGWGAYLPDLPGVVALGTTQAEASARIQEALSAYADDLRERGLKLPSLTTPPALSPPESPQRTGSAFTNTRDKVKAWRRCPPKTKSRCLLRR